MKKIINGKRYDTETADLVGEDGSGGSTRNFDWWEEDLYRKKTGEFFLHGQGGPYTRWATYGPGGGSGYGERLEPLTVQEAREWAEKVLSADKYEAIFGAVEE